MKNNYVVLHGKIVFGLYKAKDYKIVQQHIEDQMGDIWPVLKDQGWTINRVGDFVVLSDQQFLNIPFEKDLTFQELLEQVIWDKFEDDEEFFFIYDNKKYKAWKYGLGTYVEYGIEELGIKAEEIK